ncbi:hypothetical protein B0H13DRAFT_2343692 [Mycena leptocephala]|nr:hypothetical protein B0H13DRAFT_2343692 [Mycena leptocephala]
MCFRASGVDLLSKEERVMTTPGNTEKWRERKSAYTENFAPSSYLLIFAEIIFPTPHIKLAPSSYLFIFAEIISPTPHINLHSRVAGTLIIMLVDVYSPHKLIAVYNPNPVSHLTAFSHGSPTTADQIRIMGHAMQEPRFQRVRTELAYHRNIVGDVIIPEIAYKNLLLFGAHPVLMYDVLALPKFDTCAPELTSNQLESIMSARWDAIVSTGRHNPAISWFSKPTTNWTAKPGQARRPSLLWCIGFWVLVWAITLGILSCCWPGGVGGCGNCLGIGGSGYGDMSVYRGPSGYGGASGMEVQAAMVVRVAMEVQAAMEVQVAMEVQAAMGVQVAMEVQVGMEVQVAMEVQAVMGVQVAMGGRREGQEGLGVELVGAAPLVWRRTGPGGTTGPEEGLVRVVPQVLGEGLVRVAPLALVRVAQPDLQE